jgi:hypothetical protein
MRRAGFCARIAFRDGEIDTRPCILSLCGSAPLLHSVFFFPSQLGERLQPEFLWIHLSESQTDEEHLRLVDQADLFGNRQDEVVAKLVSLRNADSWLHGFSQNERRRPLGTNFQNRAVGLFVVSAQEK